MLTVKPRAEYCLASISVNKRPRILSKVLLSFIFYGKQLYTNEYPVYITKGLISKICKSVTFGNLENDIKIQLQQCNNACKICDLQFLIGQFEFIS